MFFIFSVLRNFFKVPNVPRDEKGWEPLTSINVISKFFNKLTFWPRDPKTKKKWFSDRIWISDFLGLNFEFFRFLGLDSGLKSKHENPKNPKSNPESKSENSKFWNPIGKPCFFRARTPDRVEKIYENLIFFTFV